jgi:hypothetical protein
LTFTHVIMRDNTYDMVGFQQVLKSVGATPVRSASR